MIPAILIAFLFGAAVVFAKPLTPFLHRLFAFTVRPLLGRPMPKAFWVPVLFAFAVALRLALLPLFPAQPLPVVHDECSNVLLGQTFASGRLTNPTPPCWQALQTFHVIMHPTYTSKFLPGQAAFLALGIVLFSDPWYGVLISYALMCALVFWALSQYLPARWALLGYALCLITFADGHYWSSSFWGGAVAASGGALIFGSFRPLWRKPGVFMALLFVSGVSLLLLSRPSEGLVFCLPVIGALGWKIIVQIKNGKAASIWRPAVCLIAGAFIVIGFFAYYNYKVSGSWKTPPQLFYGEQYYTAFPYVWQEVRHSRSYDIPEFHRYFNVDQFEGLRHPGKEPSLILDNLLFWKYRIRTTFFSVPLLDDKLGGVLPWPFGFLLLALGVGACLIGRRWGRLAWAASIMVPLSIQSWWHLHYAASFYITLLYLVVMGVRGVYCTRLIPKHLRYSLCAALLAILLVFVPLYKGYLSLAGIRTQNPYMALALKRKQTVEMIKSSAPGPHLVFVQYQPDHDEHDEWVYNEPDPTKAPIVWVRYLPQFISAAKDCYPDRSIWLLNPDFDPPRLTRLDNPS
jgi:hypothetical protein